MSCNIITYSEHNGNTIEADHAKYLIKDSYSFLFPKKRGSLPCFIINKNSEDQYKIETSYFIGLDWLEKEKTAIYIEPKLNIVSNNAEKSYEVDFTKMLFSSLRHPEVSKEIEELYIVKWDSPTIEIEQKQDLLTPFLVAEYLSILKNIVRKGIKKSYYKVEQNLYSRVKGKVMVGKSIKHNLLQNKNLHTFCTFDEFGVNNKENRLLKKALEFVKRYLPNYIDLTSNNYLQNTFNYINPAFSEVSSDIELPEIKQTKSNSFYKEYTQATRLAKLILKRFGYNITNTSQAKVQTPPFWIDMSKLFEIYTLGLLKDRFHKDVMFQYSPDRNNELDYLLNSESIKMVIDAKYKSRYIRGKHEEDIRQVSGYARLKSVYSKLDKNKGDVIDCLIIYPDIENGVEKIEANLDLKQNEIKQYFDVYKLGIKLPII